MKLGLSIAIPVLATFILTGCGIKTSEYTVSADNVQKLRSHNNVKLGVSKFTAVVPGENSILCRLADTVETPNDEAFEMYIENALKDELKMAGIYDENADIKLTGKVKKVSASTMLGNAYWSFDINVSSSNGKNFDLESRRDYGSAFLALTACNNMGSSFGPSVKKLIEDIITHPKFNELITSK